MFTTDPLKQRFFEKSSVLREEIRAFIKANGNKKVDEVTLSQLFGGARRVKMMVWEPSALDPIEGIRFRGYSIPQLRELLPRCASGREPVPEALFWLMLTGDLPTKDEVKWVTDNWAQRSNVPESTYKILDSLPSDMHPMTQFTIAINSMQSSSIFARRYSEGMNRGDYWDATYEDAMNLIARLPRIAAYIFRKTYFEGKHIEPDISLDIGGNFARMLGVSDDDVFYSLIRLYLVIHADHEGGNASAHTTHLVNSTLSDPYLSFAAGINALAGPLHGLANQEVIKWIFQMVDVLGTKNPTKKQIADYVHATLAAGRVIPGYGHAVLRRPDPRFVAQKEFAEKHIKDSNIVKIVWKIFEVVPPILQGLGKVKNPWPNVDAHSGALLVNFGLKQYDFYTVLFGVSRAMGVMASLCWSRALGFPLERPKSVTYDWLKNYIAEYDKESSKKKTKK